jgi:hypothetical protein
VNVVNDVNDVNVVNTRFHVQGVDAVCLTTRAQLDRTPSCEQHMLFNVSWLQTDFGCRKRGTGMCPRSKVEACRSKSGAPACASKRKMTKYP